MASELKVNFYKSKLFGIGVPDSEVVNGANILSCDSGSFPFTCLELPIGYNMCLKINWSPIIENVSRNLSDYNSKAISFGDRLTLVKSVLGSMPLYYFSLFRAHASIINHLKKIRRRFLWGDCYEKNKSCWVNWKVVLAGK